jgi:hypothetical protein
MKKFLLIFISISVLIEICKSEEIINGTDNLEQLDTSVELKAKINYILLGTDSFKYSNFRSYIKSNYFKKTIYINKDSTIFHYKDYNISTISNNGDVGEIISVFDNNGRTICLDIEKFINLGPTYFKGIIKDILIIDCGTSPTRDLFIIDLKKMNILLKTEYQGTLLKVDNKLKFDCILNEKDNIKLPPCDQEGFWHIEEQFYNFQNKSLTRTGKIYCKIVN